MQLINAKLHAPCIQIKRGRFECALLQSPIKDCEAALLIDKHLEVSARTIDENKGVTPGNDLTQFIGDNAAELIKPFAHISLLSIEMITPLICEMKQRTHATSSFKNEALTG